MKLYWRVLVVTGQCKNILYLQKTSITHKETEKEKKRKSEN